MKYAYYPGCSLHSTGSEFNISLRAISPKLDVELEEIDGWICCGSTPAHSVSELLALALPVANLSLIEEMKVGEVVVPCASCFRRLKSGHHEVTSTGARGIGILSIARQAPPDSMQILCRFGQSPSDAGLPPIGGRCSSHQPASRPRGVDQIAPDASPASKRLTMGGSAG